MSDEKKTTPVVVNSTEKPVARPTPRPRFIQQAIKGSDPRPRDTKKK